MAFRAHYWSNSKFADWIRRKFGAPTKLKCGTSEEWHEWGRESQAKHGIVHWIADTFLDKLQDFFNWPLDKLDDIRTYCRNRFIDKLHYAPTRLEAGKWHETDTRMLHANFELLVDFIEVEKAHMALWSDSSKPRPWWRKFRLTSWAPFRSKELGMEYLQWEASLAKNEDWVSKDDPTYGQPTPQAEAAKEQIALYTWWKEVRPARPDPMDASGLTAHYEQRRNDAKAEGDESMWAIFNRDKSDDDRANWKEMSDKCHALEQQYDDEDTEMLIRLIKIRHHLWT